MKWIVGLAVLLFVLYLVLRVMRAIQRFVARVGRAFRGTGGRRQLVSRRAQWQGVDERPAERTKPRWYGPGTTLKVGTFRIQSPLVYASDRATDWSEEPSEINVRLPMKRGDSLELDYWPWYSRISPAARFAYVEWLAQGRSALPSDDGLLFLFFYGLERRALVDREDRAPVFREVLRIRALDAARPKQTSFRRYSGQFLALLAAQGTDDAVTDDWLATNSTWDDETLAVALSLLQKRGVPLSAKFAFVIAELSPQSTKGVVLRRVGDRFRELFEHRYEEKFAAGPRLEASTRHQVFRYKAASGALGEFQQSIDGVLQRRSQFNPIIDLWNRCVDDLRSLSRLEPGDAATTPAQWEALPSELRKNTEHPLAAKVRDLVRNSVGDAAVALVSAGALAEVCGVTVRSRLTATQSRTLAKTVEHCGLGIEPDARITSQAYAWDGRVAVFSADLDSAVPSPQYLAASRLFRLGVAVADGTASEAEMERLCMEIESSFHLEEGDRRRLAALRTVLLNSTPERVALARKIVDTMTSEARLAVGRLLVAIAVADGVVTREELRVLRQGFRQLGLPPEELETIIAQLLPAQASDLVPVKRGEKAAIGEPIPPPPVEGLRLDRGAIHSILAETKEVAQLLAAAMDVDEDVDPTSGDAQSIRAVAVESAEARPSEPPARYVPFLSELKSRERWTRGEAEALARKYGQMLDGAIEALNDWSFETRGTSLVDEDGDDLVVA